MEKLMQYVWQYRLWPVADMVATDGSRVRVIDPGRLNSDSGPDFFNAKVLIGDKMWAGNVEIHVRASDWLRHHHDTDQAYNSVILHVVAVSDRLILRPDGTPIPQLVMDCARDFALRYDRMVNSQAPGLQCAAEIKSVSPIYITDWITAMAFERIYAKSDRMLELVSRFTGSWNDAIYVTLARALGFGTNAQQFEQLALSLPLKYLLHHTDDISMVEAMLFGQSGLLDLHHPADSYTARLVSDYKFLAAKYSLRRPTISWKTARMRPPNFPHRRIATLAALVCGCVAVSNRVFDLASVDDAERIFHAALSPYWRTHYTFGPEVKDSSVIPVRTLSRSSLAGLIINVVVPAIFAYGVSIADDARCAAAIDILHALRPEENKIVAQFQAAGVTIPDAFSSQAVIQARKEYCDQRKCLFCRLGHRFLSEKVRNPT